MSNDTYLVVFNATNNPLDTLGNSIINESILTDGSIRYTASYKAEPSHLPKLNAVVLDPVEKWNGHPKVSLEFKRYHDQESKFTLIHDKLNWLGAKFEQREISYVQGVAIDIIRITSNSTTAIAYFSNLYKEVCFEAYSMLVASMPKMERWRIDQEEPTLPQDFSIWMAHWSDPEDNLLSMPESANILPVGYCYDNSTYNLDQQNKYEEDIEKYRTNHLKYSSDVFRQKKEIEIKTHFRELPIDRKESLFKELLSSAITQRVERNIKESTQDNIESMIKKKKLEDFLNIFKTVEQCQSFLQEKHPTVLGVVKNITDIAKKRFKAIEGSKWNVADVAKNAKDVTSLLGALIFDFPVGASLGTAVVGEQIVKKSLPIIGKILDGSKASAIATSLGIRWYKPKDNNVNKDKFIEEFVCIASTCNIKEFLNLTVDDQEEIAKSYAKHIDHSFSNDKKSYTTQSTIVHSYLESYGGNHNKTKCIDNIRYELKISSNDTDTSDVSIENQSPKKDSNRSIINVNDSKNISENQKEDVIDLSKESKQLDNATHSEVADEVNDQSINESVDTLVGVVPIDNPE